MKITLVCAHCCEPTHPDDLGVLEINFLDAHIHFLCPKCRKMNKVQLKKPDQPLPRTARLGR